VKQSTLLRDQNSELEQSLSNERIQSQGLREQLEKQKAETAKFQSERDDLAKKLDAANKEIRDLKLALDSSPQALRLARQRLAMAQSTIAKLTQENSELTESLGTKTKELSSLRLALKSLPPRLQVLSQVTCRHSLTCQRAVTQISAEITRLANP
jgi:chromosome segregation ATPase